MEIIGEDTATKLYEITLWFGGNGIILHYCNFRYLPVLGMRAVDVRLQYASK